MRASHLPLLFTLLLTLCSCVGYRVGGQKPSHLAHVNTIYVPVFKNDTQFPRAAVIGTHSFLDSLSEDGTYRIAHLDESDARIEATVTSIRFSQARSDNNDVLRSEELEMRVTISWRLLDTNKSGKILAQGIARGRTRFFVDDNLQTARNNALPDALQRASIDMVSRIADGF